MEAAKMEEEHQVKQDREPTKASQELFRKEKASAFGLKLESRHHCPEYYCCSEASKPSWRASSRKKRCQPMAVTILLLFISHELYLQARSLYPSNQKCLPLSGMFLIRLSLAAPSQDSPSPEGILTTTSTSTSTTKTNLTLMTEANNATTITVTTTIANNSTTITAPINNATSKHHNQQQQQQHNKNVLCNSRCNCVILDPLLDLAALEPSELLNSRSSEQTLGRSWSPPGGNTSTATSRPDNNGLSHGNYNRSTTSANNTTSQRVVSEQALIEFNEDYSLDYEQQQPANGNDDPGALDVDSTASGSSGSGSGSGSGSDRAPSRQVDPSSARVWSEGSRKAGNGGAVGTRNNSAELGVHESSDVDASAVAQIDTAEPKQTTTIARESHSDTPRLRVNYSDLGQRSKTQSEQLLGATGASKEPAMTLFSLPSHLHHYKHLHHHHHQPLINGRDSSGPQLHAQSLYSSQAPKLSYHAHTPYIKSGVASGAGQFESSQAAGGHHHTRSSYLSHHLARGLKPGATKGSQETANLYRLAPLKTLNMVGKLKDSHSAPLDSPDLTNNIEAMLRAMDENQVESLVLSDNNIQFDLWSELYALLVVQMRQQLFHLDLSHNSLTKLGITFTGYIEHHLAAAHGNWPFSARVPLSQTEEVSLSGGGDNKLTHSKSPLNGKLNNGRLKLHTLLSAGKLYTKVQQRLSQNRTLSVKARNDTGSVPGLSANANLQQSMLIRAIDLSHNKLKWLINDQFRALKYVQTIRLDHNRIRYIHQHAFSGLESLRFLNLNFNRLQVIYIEQFQTNYNLLALMLRSNFIAYLRGGTFASLSNLKRLDLSKNKLTILSNNAFIGLESLKLLNCSSNQFVHVPSASLHPLTSLRLLDLSDNLMSQLAPGTFFHLPIEELWLSQNEQLVAIDRGAFWDLPYLRKLHLASNPMLMSINSQAFVATQNLNSIDIEDCQSLDVSGRQLLENITTAATSRLLRYEQSRNSDPTLSVSSLDIKIGPANSSSIVEEANINSSRLAIKQFANGLPSWSLSSSSSSSSHHIVDQVVESHTGRLKYVYYLSSVTFLAILLKLVFKFTSTSHYLEARRRHRRVYQAKGAGEFGPEDGDSVLSSAYAMCVQPNKHLVIGGALSSRSPVSGSSSGPRESDSSAPSDMSESEGDVNNDISVISDTVGAPSVEAPSGAIQGCCPDCPQPEELDDGRVCCPLEAAPECEPMAEQATEQTTDQPSGQLHLPTNQGGVEQSSALELIHSQLVAAGFDYGHANCAHFYQSLGPALQFADMTANFVNSMDYY